MNKNLLKTKELKDYFQKVEQLGAEFKDSNGNSLLHLAVQTKELNQAQIATLYLLERGQSIEQVNNEGKTPSQLAEENSSLDIYFWLKNPDIKLYEQIDHIGQFYHNLRTEGENTECVCLIYDKDTKKDLVKLVYLHEKYGGWRLLEYCFQKAGLDGGFSQVKLKTKGLIFYCLNLLNLFLAIFSKVLKKYSWKTDINKPNRSVIRLKYLEINEVDTLKFLRVCKNKKELFYTTLIKICNDVLVDNLLTKKERTHWLITLPNPYKEKKLPHNYNDFAFLPFSIGVDDSAELVKKRVGIAYSLLFYLKVLWEIKIFNKLYEIAPNIVRKKMRNGENRFATFSFFGKKRYEKNVGLYGATNANCFSAITIVTIIENNKLVLSLDIHPSYVKDVSELDAIMDVIKKRVEQYE